MGKALTSGEVGISEGCIGQELVEVTLMSDGS